jgi:hypothetical protein
MRAPIGWGRRSKVGISAAIGLVMAVSALVFVGGMAPASASPEPKNCHIYRNVHMTSYTTKVNDKTMWRSPPLNSHSTGCSDVNVDLTSYSGVSSAWFYIQYLNANNVPIGGWRGGLFLGEKDGYRVVFYDIPNGRNFEILASSQSVVFNAGV